MTVDPSWVEIPKATMDELRERGDRAALHRSPHLSPQQFGGALGQPEGFPVHFVDGKYYIEMKPHRSREIQEALRIFELLEVGTLKYDQAAHRIGVWEGRDWAWFPVLAFDQLDLAFPAGPLTPANLQRLKDWMAEHEEEEERLALRRALEEAQAEEDS
jgi:hypothetical protein